MSRVPVKTVARTIIATNLNTAQRNSVHAVCSGSQLLVGGPRTALSQCETDLSSFHFGPPGAWVPRRMHAKGIAMSACPGGALRALQHDQNPPGSCANVCGCVHVALDPRKGKTIARAQACSRRHLATFHLCWLPCSRLRLHRCPTSHLWEVTSHLQVGETRKRLFNPERGIHNRRGREALAAGCHRRHSPAFWEGRFVGTSCDSSLTCPYLSLTVSGSRPVQ